MTKQPTLSAFEGLWIDLGCKGDASAHYGNIVLHYSAPDRHYHTLEHIYWGLKRARELGEAEGARAVDMLPVYWAVWFHDMHMSFDPRFSSSDEELSAAMACTVANSAGLSTDFQAAVYRLIMATAHLKPPAQRDEAILVDADLSILGASPDDFAAYEASIRKEWAHVADADFYRGREKVLQRFACMPRIFTTSTARGMWEDQAKRNISRSRELMAVALNRLEPALEFKETIKGFFHNGKDHTRILRLMSSDYDRYQRDTTDADLLTVLMTLRDEHPDRYANLMAELNAYT